jgi:protein-L-isoaspartate(D-aspartate) O-methyltransferase
MTDDQLSEHEEYRNQRRRMVNEQLIKRGIRNQRVLDAMAQVPRHEFMPPDRRVEAYYDGAVPIGQGQTISQPYMVAYMVESLRVEPEHRVLEVGAGSGYQAAVLSRLAAEVYAIELIPLLASRAEQALQRLGYENVHIISGDGSIGYADAAPYDRIIVAAAAPEVSSSWIEQLTVGGLIVAPLGGRFTQVCTVMQKTEDGLDTLQTIGCVFVPLLGRYGWDDDRQ